METELHKGLFRGYISIIHSNENYASVILFSLQVQQKALPYIMWKC